MSDGMTKIKVWSDSNANIHSRKDGEMEIESDIWEAASEQERQDIVLEHMWQTEMLSFGWEDGPTEAAQ